MAIVPFTDPKAFGVVGGHANMEEWNAITRGAQGTETAPFGFGQPVQRDGDHGCEAWDGESAVLGVTRWTIDDDPETGYVEGARVSIMTQGVMWVAAGTAADAGVQAGYNATTDRWGAVSATAPAVPGVEFETAAVAGQSVKIRIQRPAPAVIATAP